MYSNGVLFGTRRSSPDVDQRQGCSPSSNVTRCNFVLSMNYRTFLPPTYMYTLLSSSLVHVDNILPTQLSSYHSQHNCWPLRDPTPLTHDQSPICIGLRDIESTAALL